MSRTLVMHIDEAPWIRGGPRDEGGHADGGGQLIGDRERGPWIHVNWLPGGFEVPPHHHSHDEILYVVDGGLVFGGRRCGPGTVLYLEKGTEYGFRVFDEGVRFLNIRPGLATITMHGRTEDPYGEPR